MFEFNAVLSPIFEINDKSQHICRASCIAIDAMRTIKGTRR